MNQNEDINRRRFFRLRLPEDAMLKATIFGQTYDVIEVAELSLCVTSRNVRHRSRHCKGVVYWSDGSGSDFTGELGHRNHSGRAILNVQGITTKDIVNETRRLIARYPLGEW